MPFPALLLWGAAAAVGAYGVKKGIDAYNDFDRAKEIGARAERKYDKAKAELEQDREHTNSELVALGKLKVDVFKNQIKYLLDVAKRRTKGRPGSQIQGFKEGFSVEDLRQCEKALTEISLLEASGDLAGSVATGALMSLGAYGAVGALATASTGTAIAGLSGAAAQSAILAWLGGGSLAAGGFGMAGGMIALGGIALAPVLAIGGFIAASKAEEAVSNAYDYESKVDKACAEMDLIRTNLKGIVSAKHELYLTISKLAAYFDVCKVDEYASDDDFYKMMSIGRVLKDALDVSILDKEGAYDKHIKAKCEGLCQYIDEETLMLPNK